MENKPYLREPSGFSAQSELLNKEWMAIIIQFSMAQEIKE